MDLGEGWSHVVRGGRIVSATTPSPTPNPIPQPVTEALKQQNLTATSKTAKPKKPAPKTTVAPKAATVKPKKPAAASSTTVAAQPTINQLVVTPHPTNSPLDGISDLLDNLPLEACVELTRRLLTSLPSPWGWSARGLSSKL
jgi:hypothetical protein